MKPVVGIMAQGSMGAATAERLTQNGVEVLTVTAGRSKASAERAAKAGMKSVSEDAFRPGRLRALHRAAGRGDPARQAAGAVPDAVGEEADLHRPQRGQSGHGDDGRDDRAPSKCHFLDGGIIGGPPRPDGYSPVYYVSGLEPEKAKALEEYGIRIASSICRSARRRP